MCRYAGEVGDRYVAWFALDAHADAVIITRLCKSLGMCPLAAAFLDGGVFCGCPPE